MEDALALGGDEGRVQLR